MAQADHRPKGIFNRAGALLTLFLITTTAGASTVMEVGIADLMEQCELVIHGRVLEQWVELDADTDTIFTSFRIDIEDVVKGSPKSSAIILKFAGGTLAGQSLSIGGMVMPIVGEEGVYFVEQLGQLQVNPLYGWQQGHFVVRRAENGIDKIISTYDLRPIYSVSPASRGAEINFSSGIPLGVRTEKIADESPLTLPSFIKALRSISEGQ